MHGDDRLELALPASGYTVNGQYTIRVRATDNAGNVQSPSSSTYRYDAALPTATLNLRPPTGTTPTRPGTAAARAQSAARRPSWGFRARAVELDRCSRRREATGTARRSRAATEVYVQGLCLSSAVRLPGPSFPAAGSYVVRAPFDGRRRNTRKSVRSEDVHHHTVSPSRVERDCDVAVAIAARLGGWRATKTFTVGPTETHCP